MKYLLDTHVLIWFQEGNASLPVRLLNVLKDSSNEIIVSQISLFEIAIKQAIGKLPLFTATIGSVYRQILNDDMTFLPLPNGHIEAYGRIPLHPNHRDPFDRLLPATALSENVSIITGDANFSLYTNLVSIFW